MSKNWHRREVIETYPMSDSISLYLASFEGNGDHGAYRHYIVVANEHTPGIQTTLFGSWDKGKALKAFKRYKGMGEDVIAREAKKVRRALS